MAMIFILFYLSIVSAAIATVFNEKFDKTLATTVFTVIISLYLFGLVGQLKLGVMFCLLLFLVALFFLVARLLKGKK